jgi:hypothetical protein
LIGSLTNILLGLGEKVKKNSKSQSSPIFRKQRTANCQLPNTLFYYLSSRHRFR